MPALQEILGYFLNWKSLREVGVFYCQFTEQEIEKTVPFFDELFVASSCVIKQIAMQIFSQIFN
jgi:hypothetical protein